MKKFILLFSALILFTTNCKKDGSFKNEELPDISVIDLSQENDFWDYLVLGKEDYFFLKKNNSKPEKILLNIGNKDYSLLFDENGFPFQLMVEDYIFLFDNFNGKKVDIGVITSDGEIETFREVETPNFNWDNLSLDVKSTEEWSKVIRWAGRALDAVPCALSVATTIASSGAGWPLAAWTCGNYFAGLAADIYDEKGIENGFTRFMDKYGKVSTGISCATGDYEACLEGAVSISKNVLIDHLERAEQRENDIEVVKGALATGYGDVKITLTWNTTADIDLHVADPFEEEIWWSHKFSQSGGILDRDDIDGYGPENIFWPQGQAPEGTYEVYVHHYPWSNKLDYADYTVLIQAFGFTKTFNGTVHYDETIHITDFDNSGLRPLSFKSIRNISNGIK